MSGGYRNSAVDSPGKQNTRTKYSPFSSVSSAPVTFVAPTINAPALHQYPTQGGHYNYTAAPALIQAPVVIHSSPRVSYSHVLHKGGYYNCSVDSPGKVNTRAKYSSIQRLHYHFQA
jgi:hypothetical protein